MTRACCSVALNLTPLAFWPHAFSTLQVLIYNHAVLSLWGTNSLAILLDIDEYLITAQPMVAVQVSEWVIACVRVCMPVASGAPMAPCRPIAGPGVALKSF